MKSASPTRQPLQAAGLSNGRVIGVCRCGVSPVGHGGQSVSSQRVMGVQNCLLMTPVVDVGCSGRHVGATATDSAL